MMPFDHTSFQIDTDWKLGFWQKAIDGKYFTGSLPECRKLGIDAWTVLSRCGCRCTMASFWNTFQRRIDEGTARSSLSKWRTFSADWRADKSFGYRCPWKGICLFTKEKRIYFGVAWPMFLRRMCRSHFITQPEQHRSTKRKFFVFYEKFWTAAAIWVIPKRTAQKRYPSLTAICATHCCLVRPGGSIKNRCADKGFVGHKAAKMMKRSKSTEARQQQAIEQKSALLKNVETADFLKIQHLHTAQTYSPHFLMYP